MEKKNDKFRKRLLNDDLRGKYDSMCKHILPGYQRSKNSFRDQLVKKLNGAYRLGFNDRPC